MGSLTLAIGQLQLVSEITRETANFMFAILHLGGWDFHCCIQTFLGRREYTAVKERLLDALQQASAAQVILAMNQVMGNRSYNLQNLFAEERHRIMRLLTQENLTRLDQLYTQVYRDNYGVLLAFHRDELPVPQELQVAAEVALSHRVMVSLRSLEQESSDLTTEAGQAGLVHLTELETIATEANHLRCQFDLLEGKQILERLILQALWHIVNNPNASTLAADVDRLQRIIDLGSRLHLNLSLSKAQELYLQRCSQLFSPSFANSLVQYPQKGADKNNPEIELPLSKLQNLLFGLGQRLAVDNSGLLETMAVSHPEGVFIK
jgi:alpha-amylase/alpha-mannosidase (GH57 family)